MGGPRVYFEILGCPKNTADSEYMAGLLKNSGCEIVKNPEKADVVVINTCGFIEPAKEESIDTILEFAQLKNERLKKLVVCGCLYERYKQQLKNELKEVDAFLGVHELKRISEVVLDKKNQGNKLYKLREQLGKKHIGYLKIADGCSNGCTFCSIPLIKGGFKSKNIDDLTEETQVLAEKGVKELYIIAQDTTAYMFEKGLKNQLVKLLERLEEVDGIEWIRIMYTYPSFITDELIDFIGSSKKVVNYLDIPFQHVSNKVLKDMGRLYTKEDIEKLLEKIRSKTREVAMRSTFIIGFPTEEEKDFHELLEFIETAKLDWSGFFKYYHEDGTIAYKKYNDLNEKNKESRLIEIESCAADVSEGINKRFIGKQMDVIVDEESSEFKGYYSARSYRSAYEIDGTIYIKNDRKLKPGEILAVKITGLLNPFDLTAVAV